MIIRNFNIYPDTPTEWLEQALHNLLAQLCLIEDKKAKGNLSKTDRDNIAYLFLKIESQIYKVEEELQRRDQLEQELFVTELDLLLQNYGIGKSND